MLKDWECCLQVTSKWCSRKNLYVCTHVYASTDTCVCVSVCLCRESTHVHKCSEMSPVGNVCMERAYAACSLCCLLYLPRTL